MQRKPRKNGESIINKDAMHFVLFLGVSATISYLALFSYFLPQGIEKAQTIVFTAFVIFEMFKVYLVRRRYGSANNNWLYLAIAISVLLQALVIFTPFGVYFKVVPLTINDFGIIFAGLIGFLGFTRFSHLLKKCLRKGIYFNEKLKILLIYQMQDVCGE